MREDEFVKWVTPRPSYMREIEPLAVEGVWDSPFNPEYYQQPAKITAQPEKLHAKAIKASA